MTTLSYLILFCTLAICSLVAVSIANERDRRAKNIRQRLRRLKRKVDELEEMVVEVDLLVESRAIANFINDEIIELLQSMLRLDSNASYLYANLANAEKRTTELGTESKSRTLNRLQESDAQIAKTRLYLTEAGNVLKRQYTAGKITPEENNQFLLQLNWAYLMVEVISHIAQGHRAMNRSDVLTAHAFYKRAQQSLIQSSHPDPRRHHMIRELTEILNNQRTALSLELMPETQHNPDDSSHNNDHHDT